MSRRIWIALLVVALLVVIGIFVWGQPITSESHTDTQYTESPVGLMRARDVNYRKGRIRHHHHRNRQRVVSRIRTSSTATRSAAAGTCYVRARDEFGDSGTFANVTRGTVYYHWCVGRKNPAKIVSYWTSFDSWAWWLQRWHIDESHISKESPILWTTTWCTPDGSGPCYPVQRKTLEYHFQFVRHVHIPILGWNIDQHADFYIICTVRGDSPGHHLNTECYSDMT
jgi:hypothetical protein